MRTAFLLSLTLLSVAAAREKAPKPSATPTSRSAQVIGAPDLNRTFPMEQMSSFGDKGSSFSTKNSNTPGTFHFEQRYQPKGYDTREFKTGGWWAGNFKFGTKAADTKGKYDTSGNNKTFETKTAAVKEDRDARKVASVRQANDANRPYLGPEADKTKKPLDPTNLPRITNDMRQLKTVEDVKALLNKN